MAEASYNLFSEKSMSPTEAAYVAGFMDGEGTITIGREKRAANRAGFRYLPVMVAGNTSRDGLEAVRVMCGNGRVSLCTPSKQERHKHLYRLAFSANQIRRVLPQIRPYLVIKGAQADLLSEFLDVILAGKNATAEEWQRQEDLRARIRALNHRGLTEAREPRENVLVRATKKRKSTRGTCSVNGCGRPHGAKGYCRKHYKLYVIRGGPTRYEGTCEHCGVKFITRYTGARFCSKSCNDKRGRVKRNNKSASTSEVLLCSEAP